VRLSSALFQLLRESTQGIGSAVRCQLLEPSGRLLKLGGSATAGSSSSAV